MGEQTGIAWTDHTFNPWWGCARVSPGCENCYAEAWATRFRLPLWGVREQRRAFGDKHWAEPGRWNRAAEQAGVRRRVFCASMADVFEDRDDLDEHRARLFRLIEETPALDWQLLTKRPENMGELVPAAWSRNGWPPNVWAGTTTEDNRRAERRMAYLAHVPARVRFLSVEPLLEAIDLEGHMPWLQWVIVGGESGPSARPFDLGWARSVVAQCADAGVPVFVKQLGADPIDGLAGCSVPLRDRAGADPSEWPEELRVQRFPEARS